MAGNYRTRGYWDVSTSDTAFSNPLTNAYNPWNRMEPIVAPSANRAPGQGYTSAATLNAIAGVSANAPATWGGTIQHNGANTSLAFFSTATGVSYTVNGVARNGSPTQPTFVLQANGTRLTPAQTYAALGITGEAYDANGLTGTNGIPLVIRFSTADTLGWRIIGVGGRDGGNTQGLIQVEAIGTGSIAGAGGNAPQLRSNAGVAGLADNEVIIDGATAGLTARRVSFTETTVFFNQRISIRNGARLFIPQTVSDVQVYFVNCVVTLEGNSGNINNDSANGYNLMQFHTAAPENNRPNHFWPRASETTLTDGYNYNGTSPAFQRRPPDLGRKANSNGFFSFGSDFVSELTTFTTGGQNNPPGGPAGSYFANHNQVICAAMAGSIDTVYLTRNDDVTWELFTHPSGYPTGTAAERDDHYEDNVNAFNPLTDNFATWRLDNGDGTFTNQFYNGTAWVTDTDNPDGHLAGQYDVGVYDNSSASTGMIVVATKPTAVNSQPIFNGTVPQLSSNSFSDAGAGFPDTNNNPGLDTGVVRINQYANANPVNNQYLGIQNGNSFRYARADYRVGQSREFPNRTPFGYIMSNAVTKLPDDAAVRRASVRFQAPASNGSDDARAGDVIWTTIWNPQFNEDPAGVRAAAGIRVNYSGNYNFPTTNPTNAVRIHPLRITTDTTNGINETVVTSADGRLVDTDARNPHDGTAGVNGSLEFTFLHTTGERNTANNGFTGGGGATGSFSQSQLFRTDIEMRAFWQTLNGATNGIRTLSIDVPGELARGQANQNANGDLLEDQFHPEDPNLVESIRVITNANRTEAAAQTAMNNIFSESASVDGNELYTAAKYFHWLGTTDMYPVVNQTGIIEYNANVDINPTAALDLDYNTGGNELRLQGTDLLFSGGIRGIDIQSRTLNLRGGRVSGVVEAAEINNLGSVAMQPGASATRTEFDIEGTFEHIDQNPTTAPIVFVVNVPSGETRYLRVGDITLPSGARLSLTGGGNLVITRATRPEPGNTTPNIPGLILNATGGGTITYETIPDITSPEYISIPNVLNISGFIPGDDLHWMLWDITAGRTAAMPGTDDHGVDPIKTSFDMDDLSFRSELPTTNVDGDAVTATLRDAAYAATPGLPTLPTNEIAGLGTTATRFELWTFGRTQQARRTVFEVSDNAANVNYIAGAVDAMEVAVPLGAYQDANVRFESTDISTVSTAINRNVTNLTGQDLTNARAGTIEFRDTSPTGAYPNDVDGEHGTVPTFVSGEGYSLGDDTETHAVESVTNGIMATYRNLQNYGQALFNRFGAQGGGAYSGVNFNTPTNTTGGQEWDIINTPNPLAVDIPAATCWFDGGADVEVYSGIEIRQNSLTLARLPVLNTEPWNGPQQKASELVQRYAFHVANSVNPSWISFERTTAPSSSENAEAVDTVLAANSATLQRILQAIEEV